MRGLLAEAVPHSALCLLLFLFPCHARGPGVAADAGQADSREAAAPWSAQASPAEQFAQWVDFGAGHVPSLQCPWNCSVCVARCTWENVAFYGRKCCIGENTDLALCSKPGDSLLTVRRALEAKELARQQLRDQLDEVEKETRSKLQEIDLFNNQLKVTQDSLSLSGCSVNYFLTWLWGKKKMNWLRMSVLGAFSNLSVGDFI